MAAPAPSRSSTEKRFSPWTASYETSLPAGSSAMSVSRCTQVHIHVERGRSVQAGYAGLSSPLLRACMLPTAGSCEDRREGSFSVEVEMHLLSAKMRAAKMQPIARQLLELLLD